MRESKTGASRGLWMPRPGGADPFGKHYSSLVQPTIRMSRYPSHLSPNITPTKLSKSQKSRARREPSGVFSLFQPQQIQQFKEAFSLIDQDRDGLVGERDLKDTFASLGTQSHATCRIDALILFVKRHLAVVRNDGRVAHVTPRGRRRTVIFRKSG